MRTSRTSSEGRHVSGGEGTASAGSVAAPPHDLSQVCEGEGDELSPLADGDVEVEDVVE